MLNSRERKVPRTPGLEEYTASLPSWQRPICAKPYPASSSWNPNSAESMDIPVCIVFIFAPLCPSRYSDTVRFCFASLRRKSPPNRRPLAELRFMLSRQTKQKLLSTFRRRLILTLLHTSNILSTFYFAHIYYPILHCAFKVTPRCSISGHIFLLHMYVSSLAPQLYNVYVPSIASFVLLARSYFYGPAVEGRITILACKFKVSMIYGTEPLNDPY